MDLRKLVQSGPSSYTVALPRGWVRSHRLKKGDFVQVEELPDRVVVTPARLKTELPEALDITINVDGKDARTLYRELRAAYLSARRIIFTGKSMPKIIEPLKTAVSELVALEIVDESSTSIVCRNFVNMADVSVANLIRRMDNIARSMLADMPSCFENPELPEAIRLRDHSINRLAFLVLKCIKSALLDPRVLEDLKLDHRDLVVYWELNVQLEKIGDEVKRISRLVPEVPRGTDRAGLLELFKAARKSYEDVMKSFYTKDAALSDTVENERRSISLACDRYFEKHKDIVVAEITGKLKGMMSHVSDISRLVRYLAI